MPEFSSELPSSRRARWDLFAAAWISLFALYQVMQWPLLPKFVDIYYHLSVVKGFSDAGGWVARDTWEFAPDGRPHIYPPLLHVLLSIPYRLGVPFMALARAVDVVAYPALLATFWLFVRSREGARTAFWAVFLFSSVFSAFLASVTLPAFNLAMIAALGALWAFSNGRWVAAGLLAAAVCYAHAMAGAMLGLSGLLLCVFEPSRRALAWRAFVLAAVLSSPLWIWLAVQAGAFKMVESKEQNLIEIDVLLYALALLRVFRQARQRKIDAWPVALFLGMAPALPFRQARVIGGYGVLAAAWLAALEVVSWLEALSRNRKKTAAAAAVFVAMLFAFLAPACLWQPDHGRVRIQPLDRTLARYLFPDDARDFRTTGFSIYFEKEYDQMAAVLRQRLQPDELFWTDFPHAGGILYLQTGRAMTTAMLGEVGEWEDRKARLERAKLFLWFKTTDGLAAGDAPGIIESMNLRGIADTPLAFIFENPAGGAKRAPARAVIPLFVLWGLLAAWTAALIYFLKRKKT